LPATTSTTNGEVKPTSPTTTTSTGTRDPFSQDPFNDPFFTDRNYFPSSHIDELFDRISEANAQQFLQRQNDQRQGNGKTALPQTNTTSKEGFEKAEEDTTSSDIEEGNKDESKSSNTTTTPQTHPNNKQLSLLANTTSKAMVLDVLEKEKEYVIEADMPGFQKEDVKLSVRDDVLTISAMRKHNMAEEQKDPAGMNTVRRVERTYGKIQRSLRLPKNIDISKISAKQENGVLIVSVPKLVSPSTLPPQTILID